MDLLLHLCHKIARVKLNANKQLNWMLKGQFDVKSFYSALDSQRQSKRVTWKQVAKESGVSASTLTRMGQGKRPDVDSMAALIAWSGLSADSFVKGEDTMRSQPDSLAQIVAYLRADPHLEAEAASAIEAIMKAAYEKLRKDRSDE
jgi:transcriptional regulator with XRE-family HTH domain